MNPISNPDAYDYVVISGVKTPGVARIVGAGSPRQWDKTKGPGVSGAWIKYMGTDLSEFSIILTIWTEEHWREWDAMRPMLLRQPVKPNDKHFEVVHPQLSELGIRACAVKDIATPEQKDDGLWEIEIKMIQFREPKTAIGKPDAAKVKEQPMDHVDKAIQMMIGQVQELAK